MQSVLEWKSYHAPVVIPLRDIADEKNRAVLDMIQDRMNRASVRVTCIVHHQHIRLYGWRYCVECDEWIAPPTSDED